MRAPYAEHHTGTDNLSGAQIDGKRIGVSISTDGIQSAAITDLVTSSSSVVVNNPQHRNGDAVSVALPSRIIDITGADPISTDRGITGTAASVSIGDTKHGM